MSRHLTAALLALILGLAWWSDARAGSPEVEELKQQVKLLRQRVEELEKDRAPSPAAPAAAPARAPAAAVAPAEPTKAAELATGPPEVSPVMERNSLQDQQEAAPRPGALTLDPKYKGFNQVPNTKVLIKFNAKPRVDITLDPQNTGDDNRFVTAKIPVSGDPNKGGGTVFNINSKGSQLRIDVRAPEVDGSPRFYYENDFFGSGGGEFPYRVRHLYGQYYGFIVGQTFSIFEDPDVWPDTVDYEGPNAAIFARRPLLRYQRAFADDHWQLNLGLEQPDSEVDTASDPDAKQVNHAPDGGFNVRWQDARIGHVQFATILRDIAVKGPVVGKQSVFGWGLNLASVLHTYGHSYGNDSAQMQLTYGQGLFRYSNDDFSNNDAAFDNNGNLEAIPYFAGMAGYTHHWAEKFRSTASYGYVHLDNTASQQDDAYHLTHYASANLIYQFHQRLSFGLEGLYGFKETKDGSDNGVYRVQMGIAYSIFD